MFHCPACSRNWTCGKTIILDDGGSTLCPYCKVAFHKCGKDWRIGSPGPTECPYCERRRWQYYSVIKIPDERCSKCSEYIPPNYSFSSDQNVYSWCPSCGTNSYRPVTIGLPSLVGSPRPVV